MPLLLLADQTEIPALFTVLLFLSVIYYKKSHTTMGKQPGTMESLERTMIRYRWKEEDAFRPEDVLR